MLGFLPPPPIECAQQGSAPGAPNENDTVTTVRRGPVSLAAFSTFVFQREKSEHVATVTKLPPNTDRVDVVCPEVSFIHPQYFQHHYFVPSLPCGRGEAPQVEVSAAQLLPFCVTCLCR